MSFEPHYLNTYILYFCALLLVCQVFTYTIKKVIMYNDRYFCCCRDHSRIEINTRYYKYAK